VFVTLRSSRLSLIAGLVGLAALPLAGCTEEGGSCSGCGEDVDEDGWTAEEGDCNDEDAAIFPTAPETACDGVDQDCTGEDLVPDADGDGATACPDNPEDCNDDDATVFPAAEEQCDDVDHDCDGEPFNGLTLQSWYPDTDEDTYGDDSADAVETCDEEGPDGHVLDNTDCDDEEAEINPAADEICDGTDHDCDGEVDNGLETFTWYPNEDGDVDGDGDGYGDADADGVVACDGLQPEGSALDNTDCDDAIAEVNPGATEVCNLRDDNCDAVIDEGFDVDGDGWSTCGPDGDDTTLEDNDCDDGNDQIFPDPNDLVSDVCDGVDNDCDGLVDALDIDDYAVDQDGDGDNAPTCPGAEGTDCNDFDPTLNGLDVDGDGESSCDGDCDDEDVNYNTGAIEYCEGEDTDCDGLSDDVEPDLIIDGDVDDDGFNGLLCGGDDCDDSDVHIHPVVEYYSGPQKDCEPAIRPGVQGDWHVGRVELPFHFEDNGDCYLYFRGHGDQNFQALGVVEDLGCTGTFAGVSDTPILEASLGWDDQGISNPTVVHVPTLSRPYLLFYHAKDGANRKVGLATATDPMGPFLRQDGDGVSLNAPVIDLGASGVEIDDRQVHHPVAWFDGATIHMWYTARSTFTNVDVTKDFNTVYATSSDGVIWTKYDDGATAGIAPEAIVSPGAAGTWSADRIYSPGVLEQTFDPEGGYALEHWWTGRVNGSDHSIGVGHGGTTSVTECALNPVIETEAEPRLDSFLVSNQGLSYTPQGVASGPDFGTLSIHYGGVTELDPVCCPGPNQQAPGTCTTWPWDENYLNLTCKGAYVATATNNVPVLAVTNLADNDTVASPFTLTGTVDDNAPDLTLVEAQFVTVGQGDGLSGSPTVGTLAATGNTSTAVQQTTFSVELTAAAGTYDVLVTVEDEGCSRRTIRVTDVTVQ